MTVHTEPEYQYLTEADVAAMAIPDSKARAVIAEVCRAAGLKESEIRGYSRRRRVSWPRQIAYLALYRVGYTMTDIGRIMGRDHTTVMHGIAAARNREAGL